MATHMGQPLSAENVQTIISAVQEQFFPGRVPAGMHTWNIYRYIGDGLHLVGVLVLLATLVKNRSCAGISRSTQMLRFFVFATRYLDLFDRSQVSYLVFFKLTYILTSLLVLWAFWKFDSTYERQKDTCSLAVMILPSIVGALILSDEYSVIDVCWTFSMFLAGVAMVPQYIFCYRDQDAKDLGVSFTVVALGGYRVFYAMNWIYKMIHMPGYSAVQSWMGGMIEIAFFCDFLSFRFNGKSVLRSMVLKVDTKVNEIKDEVEKKVIETVSLTKQRAAAATTRRRGGARAAGELCEV